MPRWLREVGAVRVRAVALLVVLVTLAAGGPAAGASDWLQSGFDGGHSSANVAERSLLPREVGGLELAWSHTLRPSGTIGYEQGVEADVVRAGRVFASWGADAGGSVLRAFDAATGSVLWSRRDPARGASFAACVGDAAYANVGRRILALDAATGALRWSAPGRVFAAAPAKGWLFAERARPVRVVALDAATGGLRWSRATPQLDSAWALAAGGAVIVAYRTQGGHRLVALEQADGSLRWSRALRSSAGVPLAAEGRVFTLAFDGERSRIEAVRTGDGASLWRRTFAARGYVGIQVAGEGRLFVERAVCVSGCEGDAFGAYRGALIALSAQSGRTAWVRRGGVGIGRTLWWPDALVHRVLFVHRHAFGSAVVGALDPATGRERWTTAFGTRTLGWVSAAAEGTVYVGTGSGYAAPPNSGGRLFAFRLPV